MEIEGVLRWQAGVISRRQALEAGLSGAQVDWRVASGRWYPLYPGVYLAAEHGYTAEARVRSVALWAGQDATISGVAAAWWHGLWSEPPPIVDVTIPRCRRVRPVAGARVRRRDLDWRDRVETRLMWVTELPLTVLEASVALGEAGTSLLDRALQRRVHFETLHRAHCRNLGRRGSPAAGKLLVAAADRAASQAERLVMKLLRDAGIGGWERGYWFGGHEIDIAFPDLWIAIEVDGWAWHTDVERFRRDRRKQNELALAGWRVLPRRMIAESGTCTRLSRVQVPQFAITARSRDPRVRVLP